MDVSKLAPQELATRLKNIKTYMDTSPFGDNVSVLLVPSTENKFFILETEEELRASLGSQEQVTAFLSLIQKDLKECVQRSLD
jgi:hypothetical protein